MSIPTDPHQRLNLLTGEWVLVSPQRTNRPWQGKVESTTSFRPASDPGCYLCPGNERANGERNPDYDGCFVFENDFAAIVPQRAQTGSNEIDLLRSKAVDGICRVVCFSPRHDLTLPEMDNAAVRRVVDTWAQQSAELGLRYRWVQIFENKGEIMGCSNPHPHGQIWASDSLPNEPAKEDICQRAFTAKSGKNLLHEYLDTELSAGERVVAENEHWVVVVPFWAVWPFEALLMPRRQVPRLPDLDEAERESLAEILKRFLTGYDRLFGVSFPYTMGWHGAPFGVGDVAHWQLHAHFYPPLLRSATVRKFMVGYEMLAEPQRDISPEQAAAQIREALLAA